MSSSPVSYAPAPNPTWSIDPLAWFRANLLGFLATLGAITTAVGILSLLSAVPKPPEYKRTANEIPAGLAQREIHLNQPIEFWINLPPQAVPRSLRVRRIRPSDRMQVPSLWLGGKWEPLSKAVPIEANEGVAINGQVTFIRAFDPQLVSAELETTDGKPYATVALDYAVAQPDWRWRADGWTGLSEKLILPALLPVIAFALQKLFEQREAEKKKAEDAARQAREQQANTWNAMLPRTHRMNQYGYLPILWAAGRVASYLDKRPDMPAAGPTDNDWDLLFHILLLYGRHRAIPGFYFKDRYGERLITICFDRWSKQLAAGISRDQRLALMDAVDAAGQLERINQFERMRTTPPAKAALERCMTLWHSQLYTLDKAACIQTLSVLTEVMDLEINRPYLHWYGSEEKIDPSVGFIDSVRQIVATSGKPALKGGLEEYLRNSVRG